jgi:hypothetical protein
LVHFQATDATTMHGKAGLQPCLDGMKTPRPVVSKIVLRRRKKCDCQKTQFPD